MKLSKGDVELLGRDPQAFLIRAYATTFPHLSIRQISERLGVSKTEVHRCASGTDVGTAKALRGKGKLATSGTDVGTLGTDVGTAKALRGKGKLATSGTDVGTQKTQNLVSKMRQVFDEYYTSLTGEAFYWTAKEMKSMKDIGAKIAFSLKSGGRPYQDEDILTSLPGLLKCISDPWIIQHLSPSMISSKYNEIISSYRTKHIAPKSATEARADHLSRLAQMRKSIEAGIE